MALTIRLKERRTSYSDVVQFLHGSTSDDDEQTYVIFNQMNKKDIIRTIVSLIEKFLDKSVDESETSSVNQEDDDDLILVPAEGSTSSIPSETYNNLSMKEKLLLLIKQKSKIVDKQNIDRTTQQLNGIIRREIRYFEEEKIKGRYLQFSFDLLMTIQPTSVESERASSSAGQICTSIRSRLNDESLDTLCFLRSYFNNQKELLMEKTPNNV